MDSNGARFLRNISINKWNIRILGFKLDVNMSQDSTIFWYFSRCWKLCTAEFKILCHDSCHSEWKRSIPDSAKTFAKMLAEKNDFWANKYFWPKKIFGRKHIWSKKSLAENIFCRTNLWPKTPFTVKVGRKWTRSEKRQKFFVKCILTFVLLGTQRLFLKKKKKKTIWKNGTRLLCALPCLPLLILFQGTHQLDLFCTSTIFISSAFSVLRPLYVDSRTSTSVLRPLSNLDFLLVEKHRSEYSFGRSKVCSKRSK